MRHITTLKTLSVILLLSYAVWATLNFRNYKQQFTQQQQLFKNYLLLQQRQFSNEIVSESDSLYQLLHNYALQQNDMLLLQVLNKGFQINRNHNENNTSLSNETTTPSIQNSKKALQQSAVETRRLEDSLQKIQVLLEMEQTVAREQMELFRKTSDSLLQLLKNNTTQTGILYLKSPNGISIQYVGEIKNNEANGFGMGIWENGQKYEGQWKNNIKHGWGTYYFANNEKYEGNFENNKRNGKGTYYFKSGDYYKGFWQDDVRDGIGAIFGRNGKIKKAGEWKNDKLTVNRRLTDDELQQIH